MKDKADAAHRRPEIISAKIMGVFVLQDMAQRSGVSGGCRCNVNCRRKQAEEARCLNGLRHIHRAGNVRNVITAAVCQWVP